MDVLLSDLDVFSPVSCFRSEETNTVFYIDSPMRIDRSISSPAPYWLVDVAKVQILCIYLLDAAHCFRANWKPAVLQLAFPSDL